jgi:perosamine synthetase
MTDDYIPFAQPDIGRGEIDAVVDALQSGWITTGPRAHQFEDAFAAYVGARHAIAVNSCTAALHLALEAAGIRRGDEVLVPTMTFAATAEVVRYFDAVPVLVDCRREDLNLDIADASRRITPRTKAIIPVHYGGNPCDMDALLAFARGAGLTVIEDAAHALPARWGGRLIGTLSDATCFSFYATKTLTTGEGGMITTERDDWAERMRSMSLHGISKDAWKRYTATGSWYYEIQAPGYKYNLTDMAAALGREQLRRCDEMWARRQALAEMYAAGLGGVEEVELPRAHPGTQHAWHLYPVRLRLERLSLSRAAFIEALRESGVGASVHFMPLHLHPYYRKTYGYRTADLPVAAAEWERLLSLPLYSRLTEAQIARVIATVKAIVHRHRRGTPAREPRDGAGDRC